MGRTELQIIEWAVGRLSAARKYGVIGVNIYPTNLSILLRNGKCLEQLFGTYKTVKDGEDYYGEVVCESGIRWLALLDEDEVALAKAKEAVYGTLPM